MTIQGSEPLDYQKTYDKGMEMLRKGKKFGFLLVCGVNFGLRISDLLGVTYDQLKSGEFVAFERKTGKKRIIVVNDKVKEALKYMEKIDPVHYSLGGSPFVSQKGSIYSVQHINRTLKRIFGREYSSHGLRKAYGKRLYETQGENLAIVQMQLQHSDPDHTLRYIGVTQRKLNETFHSL